MDAKNLIDEWNNSLETKKLSAVISQPIDGEAFDICNINIIEITCENDKCVKIHFSKNAENYTLTANGISNHFYSIKNACTLNGANLCIRNGSNALNLVIYSENFDFSFYFANGQLTNDEITIKF